MDKNKSDEFWTKNDSVMFDENIDTITSYTKKISSFIAKVNYNDIPDKVVDAAKILIIDTIACAFAGCNVKSSRISLDVIDCLGGKPQSTIIGRKDKTSMPFAGLANAKMANALDLDDCFMNLAHFAPQSVFAPLAVGEYVGKSGKDYITSVILGYEIAARIALSFIFWRVSRGIITTGDGHGVFAAHIFGALAGAGKIFNLNEFELNNAFGICGHFAPVLTRSINKALDPPADMLKYCDAGWSTNAGIMSALYAKKGYIAPHYTLDGRYGYWRAVGAKDVNLEILTHKLSVHQRHWYISDSALKTYPCCKYAQAATGLFVDIIEKNNIDIDEIEKVAVHLKPTHALWFSDQTPKSYEDIPITHNIPYNLTMAALKFPPNHKWQLKENLSSPEVKKLMKKIFIEPEVKALLIGADEIEKKGFPQRIFCKVDVFCKGKKFTNSTDKVKGDPWWKETKFTDKDLLKKFKICAEGVLNKKRVEQIIDVIMHLEDITNISELTELLRKI